MTPSRFFNLCPCGRVKGRKCKATGDSVHCPGECPNQATTSVQHHGLCTRCRQTHDAGRSQRKTTATNDSVSFLLEDHERLRVKHERLETVVAQQMEDIQYILSKLRSETENRWAHDVIVNGSAF